MSTTLHGTAPVVDLRTAPPSAMPDPAKALRDLVSRIASGDAPREDAMSLSDACRSLQPGVRGLVAELLFVHACTVGEIVEQTGLPTDAVLDEIAAAYRDLADVLPDADGTVHRLPTRRAAS